MSSTSISSTPSSSSPPQSTTNNASNGGPQKSGFNNFTFVIVFFILLVVFVGVGTVSRRRYMARRHGGFEFDLTMDGDELTPEEVEQARPVLYELGTNGDVVETGWKYEKPLSARLIKSTHWTSTKASIEDDAIPATHNLERPTHSQDTAANNHRTFPSFSVPSWTRGHDRNSSQLKHSSVFGEELRPIESPEALEVAVMIVMPSWERSVSALPHSQRDIGSSEEETATHSHSELHSSPGLPEYQIGMMTVPWHAELKRESIPTGSPSLNL